MNRLITKRLGTLLSALFIISSVSFSQFDNIDFLRSAPADGVKLLQAYISPYANAFGAGLNGGWYNTARPHKILGFDITTSVNVGMVPSSANTFDVTKIGLTSLTGTGMASTIAGPDISGPLMTYKVSGITLASFNAPPGVAWAYVPAPTAQIGLGLPFGTEVKFRFIPKIMIGEDGDISLWGVGVMHSLLQYLPGYKMLPLFDVSLFGGYTKLEGNIPLSLQPDPLVNQTYTTTYLATKPFDNQKLNMSVEALNINAIASLNLPVITFYGGLGYSKTKTGMELIGNFPTPKPVATPIPHAEYNESGVIKGTNFTNMDIENFSGIRANIGLRIKLAIITIHADFTRAQYNILSAGFGISIR
ncbi:MAG: hypothetical protein NT144_04515 [Bacteroidia bacterium]|nr:hypothetical protein [Bacteroidia bacterium]